MNTTALRSLVKAVVRRLRCWLRGGHRRVALVDSTTALVVCRRCLAGAGPLPIVPAAPIDPPARRDPEPPTMASAYDLVAALAADDLAGATAALPTTSVLHVATAAVVLAESSPAADLRRTLLDLAVLAEADRVVAEHDPGPGPAP